MPRAAPPLQRQLHTQQLLQRIGGRVARGQWPARATVGALRQMGPTANTHLAHGLDEGQGDECCRLQGLSSLVLRAPQARTRSACTPWKVPAIMNEVCVPCMLPAHLMPSLTHHAPRSGRHTAGGLCALRHQTRRRCAAQASCTQPARRPPLTACTPAHATAVPHVGHWGSMTVQCPSMWRCLLCMHYLLSAAASRARAARTVITAVRMASCSAHLFFSQALHNPHRDLRCPDDVLS